MEYKIITIAVFFIILISVQYSLNKMIVLLREIKEILYKINIRQ